jgi:hypothetical protein
MGGEDRSVGRTALQWVRGAHRVEALFDAPDHHAAGYLAGDAGGRGHPADDLAIVAIEGEGDAHDFVIPADDSRGIRAPAAIRADPMR